MNVASIMAHQDDEMKCLGAMLKCRARGDKLFFITLTDGSKGFVQRPTITRDEAAGIRHDEMTALCGSIGAVYINLREPDEFLYDTPDVRMRLIEAIRATSAGLIFTHYHIDYNADHITTNFLVRHCAMQASLPVLPTKSAPLAEPPAIFLVEPFGVADFAPTYFVDITEYERAKIELLMNHASQQEAMMRAVNAGFDALCDKPGAFWGDKVGCRYAEAFVPMQARGAVKPYGVLP